MSRYLTIDNGVASATFDIPKDAKRAYVELTYLGDCSPTLRHDPTSLENGRMVIHWDNNARSLMSGWYSLQIFANKCPCGTYPVRVRNDCLSNLVSEDEYNDCYECDGLPKSKTKCCSTLLKRERCNIEICPPDTRSRPQNYVPSYEEV